jgi:hypothetical protein
MVSSEEVINLPSLRVLQICLMMLIYIDDDDDDDGNNINVAA